MLKVEILPTYNPYRNLAKEEAILNNKNKTKDDVFLLFYENNPSIILGKSMDVEADVFQHKVKSLPIIRRNSGGGTVVHFKGNLNYSIIISLDQYPKLYPIQDSYAIISKAIIKNFKSLIPLQQKGLSDLSILYQNQYYKISGNSQRRKKRWLLHHGTFLYNTQYLEYIYYYLKPPKEQPDYRESRLHENFLIPKDFLNIPRSTVISYFIKSIKYLIQSI